MLHGHHLRMPTRRDLFERCRCARGSGLLRQLGGDPERPAPGRVTRVRTAPVLAGASATTRHVGVDLPTRTPLSADNCPLSDGRGRVSTRHSGRWPGLDRPSRHVDDRCRGRPRRLPCPTGRRRKPPTGPTACYRTMPAVFRVAIFAASQPDHARMASVSRPRVGAPRQT